MNDVGQGQHVKDSKAPTQRGLAIAEWVPGDSYARLKVAFCGVGEQRITQVRRGIRELPENSQMPVNFRRYGRHFIPQAQINGDVLAPTPVVLEVRSNDSLAEAPLGDGAGYRCGQEKRMICQKV